MTIQWLKIIALIYVLAKGRAVPTLESEDAFLEGELEDDPVANQESIFQENINDNVKNVHGAIKSDNQQKRVILNSHDSYNKLKNDHVAISEDNIYDNVKNTHDPNKSDGNRKRGIINNYDSMFQYQCPHGKTFDSLSSVHDNTREDRIWSASCGLNLPSGKVGSSKWTFYVNDFDGVMTFECQDGNVVTGIGAYHSNQHEDRRYKFRCTFLRCKRRKICSWTAYTNWDARWEEKTPNGYYLTGVRSYHDNHYEDRQFSFQYCQFV